jgi:hypothetical protein
VRFQIADTDHKTFINNAFILALVPNHPTQWYSIKTKKIAIVKPFKNIYINIIHNKHINFIIIENPDRVTI